MVTLWVPAGTGTLVAELPDDARPLDNRVFLPPPPVKKVRCLTLYAGKEKGFIDRALASCDGAVGVGGPPADLVIGPGTLARNQPEGSWIFALGPHADGFLSGEPKPFIGPYTIDTLHPLLESVSLRGVAWQSLGEMAATSVPLVSCGRRSLVVEAGPRHAGFLLNLDLARTNYNGFGALARASYELTPNLKPFVEGTFDWRVHDAPTDFNGFYRDSSGFTVRGGATVNLTELLRGEASGGYGERHYQDVRLAPLRGPVVDAALIYTPSALTTVPRSRRKTFRRA